MKRADSQGPFHLGDVATYSYEVVNSGNVPITNINVTDNRVTNIICATNTLDPGEATTCHGSYTISQADIDACQQTGQCQITNTATAQGTDLAGDLVTSNESTATITVEAATPGLSLEKRADAPGPFQAGDVVPYSYTVTNTGNVPLTDVHVTDNRVTDITCDTTTLNPGESTTCRGTYTVTQSDVDTCQPSQPCEVVNSAQAHGTDPDGNQVTSNLDEATITVQPGGEAELTLEKRVDAQGPFKLGDMVPFSYTVTNTGNGTVNDIRLADDRVTDITCDTTMLSPGQSTTCHGTFTITQAAIDECVQGDRHGGGDHEKCEITNTAQAHGTDQAGDAFTSNEDQATILVKVKGHEPPHPCPKPEDGHCQEPAPAGRPGR